MTLVERLINEHNQVVQYAEESPEKDGFLSGIRKAIDVVKNQNGWISVDDDLPIICTPVQVCMSDNRVWTGFYDPVIEKGWYVYGWNTNPFTVTHWQPLPSPPKE